MAGGDWTIDVDAEVCVGSGMCIAMAPDHFRLDGDRARPRDGRVDPDDVVVDAAESCPAEAIAVRRAATGELLAPT